MANDELVPGPIKDHMKKFTDAFVYFHDQTHLADLDTGIRVKLFEIWLRRYDKVLETQDKDSKPSNKATGRQMGMLRRLISNSYLTEEEVGKFEDLTFKKASDLITKGIAAEKEAKGQSEPSKPFGGVASL